MLLNTTGSGWISLQAEFQGKLRNFSGNAKAGFDKMNEISQGRKWTSTRHLSKFLLSPLRMLFYLGVALGEDIYKAREISSTSSLLSHGPWHPIISFCKMRTLSDAPHSPPMVAKHCRHWREGRVSKHSQAGWQLWQWKGIGWDLYWFWRWLYLKQFVSHCDLLPRWKMGQGIDSWPFFSIANECNVLLYVRIIAAATSSMSNVKNDWLLWCRRLNMKTWWVYKSESLIIKRALMSATALSHLPP